MQRSLGCKGCSALPLNCGMGREEDTGGGDTCCAEQQSLKMGQWARGTDKPNGM